MKKKNLIKRASILTVSLAILTSSVAFGHKGRTDGAGGHKDNKNASGLGYYHYQCGDTSAHLHNDGKCPYSKSTTSTSNTKTQASSTSSTKSNANIKAIQTKLNNLGYDCGNPDGVAGTKTKSAIKAFQKSKKITADGIAGSDTRKALGL